MNARKVLVLCALVVGVAAALEVTALAGPPSLEYRLGERPIYSGDGYLVAPKVSVPLYQASDSKLPSFYRGWSNSALAARPLPAYVTWNDLITGTDLPDNVAPLVTVPLYEFSDPMQPGGHDLWDPLGNSFAVSQLLAAADDGVWDDDGTPNNEVAPWRWQTPQWSDPMQPGGYDPWDPLGNSFGIAK